jgi:hypothetical protein
MINVELYFNDHLADFDNENTIAGTYALNRIGDIESRQGNHTNPYNLPFSPRNKGIFENAEMPNSWDDQPYRIMTHLVNVEGVEVFRGFAKIEKSFESYEIVGFSGNADFFSEIEDQDLRDLDLSDLDHIRNDANVAASWANTSGYIYAFMDYGKYVDLDVNANGEAEIMPEDLYPQLFFKTIVERIASAANYTLEGKVLSDPRFNSHLIPFNAFPFTPDNGNLFNGRKGERTSNGATGGQAVTTSTQNIVMEELNDPGNNYDALGFYTSPVKQRAKITFNFYLAAVRTVPLTGFAQIQIIKKRDGVDTQLFKKDFHNFTTASGDFELTLEVGDQIYLRCRKSTSSVFANVFVLSFQIEPQSALSYDTMVSMSDTLPDMTQSDFFIDFLNQYGLLTSCDTEKRILHLTYFDDIQYKPPVDWSNKIDDDELPEINYRFENYAQNNTLKFASDEVPKDGNVRGLITDPQEKVFTIDDDTLVKKYDAFESSFYLPANGQSFQGQIESLSPKTFSLKQESRSQDQIRWKGIWDSAISYLINDVVYDSGNYFIAVANSTNVNPTNDDGDIWDTIDEDEIWDVSSKPIIGILVNSESNAIVKFQSGDQAITKFVVNNNLNWSYVWDNKYVLFSRIIQRTKIVRHLMKLNYADINQLDLTKPVYLSRYGCYFYVDIIDQFKFNETDSTYVTFVRI